MNQKTNRSFMEPSNSQVYDDIAGDCGCALVALLVVRVHTAVDDGSDALYRQPQPLQIMQEKNFVNHVAAEYNVFVKLNKKFCFHILYFLSFTLYRSIFRTDAKSGLLWYKVTIESPNQRNSLVAILDLSCAQEAVIS